MASYIRPCRDCGERISMRQMPAGQWLAFDVSTEEVHECGIKNEPDIAVKLKGRKKFEEENDSVDLGYDEDDNNDNDNEDLEEDVDEQDQEEENKTYDSTSGIHYCIDKAIKEEKRIFIDYYSEYNDESTSREISPIKKFKYKNRNYLQAYCHKRKAERNFLTKAIETATEVDKKITKVKFGKPNIKFLQKNNEIENNTIKAKDLDEKTKKRLGIEVIDKKDDNSIPTSGPGFWLYVAFIILIMGLAKTFLIPLLN